MFNTILYSAPHVGYKHLAFGQAVMLADAPEDRCTLILLLSPGGSRRFLDMIPLSPPAIRLLNFLAPLVECRCVLIVPAPIKSICDVRRVSRPDIAVVWL